MAITDDNAASVKRFVLIITALLIVVLNINLCIQVFFKQQVYLPFGLQYESSVSSVKFFNDNGQCLFTLNQTDINLNNIVGCLHANDFVICNQNNNTVFETRLFRIIFTTDTMYILPIDMTNGYNDMIQLTANRSGVVIAGIPVSVVDFGN